MRTPPCCGVLSLLTPQLYQAGGSGPWDSQPGPGQVPSGRKWEPRPAAAQHHRNTMSSRPRRSSIKVVMEFCVLISHVKSLQSLWAGHSEHISVWMGPHLQDSHMATPRSGPGQPAATRDRTGLPRLPVLLGVSTLQGPTLAPVGQPEGSVSTGTVHTRPPRLPRHSLLSTTDICRELWGLAELISPSPHTEVCTDGEQQRTVCGGSGGGS